MQDSRFRTYRGSLGLAIVAVLLAAIQQLPAADEVQGNDGDKGKGSFISTTVNGELFEYTITPDELAEDARDGLVALIDADPDFMAVSRDTAPPGVFDSDDTTHRVLTEDGLEVDSVIACESDENFLVSGSYVAGGKSQARIRKPPTSLAGGGNFGLRLDLISAPDVNLSIDTVTGPGTALVTAITNALTGLGFEVTDLGTDLRITKPGDYFRAARAESTDTLFVHTCAGLEGQSAPPPPPSPTSIPTMSQYALVLLAVALLLVGLLMIRRKRASEG